jgi:PTH1 family peptidyl-tRNA hydrolase
MKLIIGLGNPGKEYENTRHNVGFMVLNYFPGNNDWHEKFNALYHDEIINNEKVVFIKPLTFMNLSGDAVIKYINYYNINTDDILVIQDDIDLSVGKYRLKYKSSCGGHNGMRSIINNLGTESIPRLKVGISRENKIDTKDYVLGKFNKSELEILTSNFPIYKEIIEEFIMKNIDSVMLHYNKK